MNFKIINPDVIRKSMMDNDELITQFVELYLAQSPIDFEALTKSIEENNPQAIGAASHHIKPTMEYIGASALRMDFQALEKLGYQGANTQEIQNKYQEIKAKFDLMLQELALFIETK